MIFMAKVVAIITDNRGRFARLLIENEPPSHLLRFDIHSETLQLHDRVKCTMELHAKKAKVEAAA